MCAPKKWRRATCPPPPCSAMRIFGNGNGAVANCNLRSVNFDSRRCKISEDIKMASSNSFRLIVDCDAAAEESLRTWAASKFMRSHLGRDQAGHLIMSCAHTESKTAKSFKLMLRNFEQHSGTCIGKILDMHLLDERATVNDVVDPTPPTVEPETLRPGAESSEDNAEIVASLPPDFDRKAKEKYEKMFVAIRVC